MRRQFISFSVSICFIAALAGCEARPTLYDTVLGIDLGHHGPFDSARQVTLSEISTEKDSPSLPRLEITRGESEDSGVVENILSNSTKPLLAGVSYSSFKPIIAETNAEARDYWLVGLNMTRTPDRSVYILLRYPHGLDIRPGLSSDAFEYLTLECDKLDVARHPVKYYAPRVEGTPPPPEPKLEPEPEAGACEFNSLAEAARMTPLVLKRYDQIKRYESAPTLSWTTLHVEVK